jgi:hypothetical protein
VNIWIDQRVGASLDSQIVAVKQGIEGYCDLLRTSLHKGTLNIVGQTGVENARV